MTTDDVRMNCAMAESLTPVMSFSRVRATPYNELPRNCPRASILRKRRPGSRNYVISVRLLGQRMLHRARDALINRSASIFSRLQFKRMVCMTALLSEQAMSLSDLTTAHTGMAGLQALNSKITLRLVWGLKYFGWIERLHRLSEAMTNGGIPTACVL